MPPRPWPKPLWPPSISPLGGRGRRPTPLRSAHEEGRRRRTREEGGGRLDCEHGWRASVGLLAALDGDPTSPEAGSRIDPHRLRHQSHTTSAQKSMRMARISVKAIQQTSHRSGPEPKPSLHCMCPVLCHVPPCESSRRLMCLAIVPSSLFSRPLCAVPLSVVPPCGLFARKRKGRKTEQKRKAVFKSRRGGKPGRWGTTKNGNRAETEKHPKDAETDKQPKPGTPLDKTANNRDQNENPQVSPKM